MILTLSAKELDQETKYIHLNKKIELNQPKDFLIKKIEKEVRQENKKSLKKYAKICKVTITTAALLLTIVQPTLAATTIPAPVPNSILPSDIVKVGTYLIGISMAASTILAIILSQLAGGYRMLRKGDEATKWTTDILKGYTQVLVAPFLIGAIAFVVYLLFGDYNWFLKIF